MKTHDIKAWPHFYEAMLRGDKTFEIRRDDRHYHRGDKLVIKEYDPSYGFTGREMSPRYVSYVMRAEDFPAIMPGFVVLGLSVGVPAAIKSPGVSANRCKRYLELAGEPLPEQCEVCLGDGCIRNDV